MDVILVPGLWLNASTWDQVVPLLADAGHRPHPLTLPGMEAKDADRSGIALADHVGAVVQAIDDAQEPALLVGHSAGCAIAYAALDARPDRIARIVLVGGWPAANGTPLLTGLPARDGEVLMPDWAEVGEEANVVDFEPAQLTAFYDAAIPVPEAVLTTPVRLVDERRYAVPATAVCPEYTAAQLREWIDSGESAVAELTRIRDVSYVDLPGGHWPQLTQPDRLGEVILTEAGRS
ncbi:MAG: alpha/beta fold hydrolase [Nocardioides sp.]|uniref:alpha/beta fold hydrolase n=1 Tax=Nocardioides sp. TaxID=35761 RepID=UPI0039E462AD